jgi:hypothetical protein
MNALTPAVPSGAFDFQFHPLADMFPMLEGNAFFDLVDDIKANGLREPITLYEEKILDGRNRHRAAKEAKVTLGPENFRRLPEGMDPKAFVISANIHRRHLTAEQKRDLLAELIKADPTQSNRRIAAVAKVDHKTAGAVRTELEATGEIPQLPATTGKDGKKRKPRAKRVEGKKGKGKNQIVINEEVQPTHANFVTRLELMVEALREWPKGNVDLAKEWADEARERIDEVIEQLEEADDEGEAEGEQPAAQLQ